MNKLNKKPELLAPAGSLKTLHYAFAYGADAVYAGQPRYSLRVRNNEFNHENLKYGIDIAKSLGKKFYVVVNIAPHNVKLKTFLKDIEPVINMQPHALIMSDTGLISIMRKNYPDINIHLSVQANAINWASVAFWRDMGLKRVILSRELSLDEIEEIKQHVTGIELEVFVHGALCMAYSGRCLLSGYINHRDSNQGACTNACRWQYRTHEAIGNETGDLVHKYDVKNTTNTNDDKVFLLEEYMRPGEYMEASEDEHGTYIMNSKDLRAIEHVERLSTIGIDSLKIEGRTKSHFYCARTVQAYRQAIDDAYEGKSFDIQLLDNLNSLANRGYTEGFLRRHTHDAYHNYLNGSSLATTQQFVGELTNNIAGHTQGFGIVSDRCLAEVIVKNKFAINDTIEIMTTYGNYKLQLTYMENKKGESIELAPGDGHIVYVLIPIQLQKLSFKYALLLKDLQTISAK